MAASENIKKPLKDWLADFEESTGKISELIRNLALALIAIVWVFKTGDLSTKIDTSSKNHVIQHLIPIALVKPLIFVVLALISDLSQYIWKAINIRVWYEVKSYKFDKGKIGESDIEDVKFPSYIEAITWLFFIAKITLTVFGYYYLYQFLLTRI